MSVCLCAFVSTYGYEFVSPYIRTGGACDLPRSAGNRGSQNGNWSYGGTAQQIVELASDLDSWHRVLSADTQSGPKLASFSGSDFLLARRLIFGRAVPEQLVSAQCAAALSYLRT